MSSSAETPTSGPPSSNSQRTQFSRLWVLMVTAFVDMIGFALILPLLPYYATRFGADAFTVGLLMAAFAFGQMTMAPFWGRLSDRFGRKPVMLGAQALSAVAFAVFAFAGSVAMLFLCRLLQGIGSGSIGSVNAYVSDAVEPGRRAQALGWITACTSAGVMVGPAIGSLTVDISYAAPGLIAAGMSLLNLLFTWIWLEETRTVSQRRDAPKPRAIREQLTHVIANPTQITSTLIWVYTAGMMAFMSMTGMLALYLDAAFGIGEDQIGWFYVGLGAVSVVMRGLILGILVRKLGEVRVLRLGAILLGIGMLAGASSTSLVVFGAALLLIPTGTALLFPSTTSLLSRYADPEQVGQTMGVQQTFGGISRLSAPILAGFLFEHLAIEAPFYFGGALVLLVALFSLRLHPGEAPRPAVS